MKNYVYCLKIKDLVKIGITTDIKKRFRNIEHSTGNEIEKLFYLESCASLEKIAHNHFKKYRKKGEWFDIDFEDAKKFLEENKIQEKIYNSKNEIENKEMQEWLICMAFPEFKLKEFLEKSCVVFTYMIDNNFEEIKEEYKKCFNFYWKQLGFDFDYTNYVNIDFSFDELYNGLFKSFKQCLDS